MIFNNIQYGTNTAQSHILPMELPENREKEERDCRKIVACNVVAPVNSPGWERNEDLPFDIQLNGVILSMDFP